MQELIGELLENTGEQKQAAYWNVPIPLTALIGREEEIATICDLLSRPEIRLLTLLGPGGIGKTSLSIEVVTRIRTLFPDGVCFVPLAAINDSAIVPLILAQTLGILEIEMQPVLHQVIEALRNKELLLLFDNFEQIMEAAQDLLSILQACPGIKMLVTSRATLHIMGGQEFQVQPLTLPPANLHLDQLTTLTRYAAVALFLQRVQAQLPDFQITSTNAHAIAAICTQLDGLPLAIELAAARIKLLPPQTLLARLSRRLQLLTGGPSTLPERQQTLRNTLQWSYDLLDAYEQQLFRRISVFKGGCSLAALEYLYTTLDENAERVLDDATSLINKSLLQQIEQDPEEPRLILLETIREYGLERLAESEEAARIHVAYVEYYLELVEKIEPELEGSQQAARMIQLEKEHENLRAVLRYMLHGQEQTQNRAEIALRLGVGLRRFWLVRGYLSEGQIFLEQALAIQNNTTSLIYAKALLTLGTLVSIQGDYKRAKELCSESLNLFRKLNASRSSAAALYQLGRLAWMNGDLRQARLLAEDALTYSRTSGHQGSIAWSLFRLARLVIEQGDYARGQALLEENLELHRGTGNKRAIATSLYHLAWVHLITGGDAVLVRSLLSRAQTIFAEVSDKEGIAYSLYLSGRLALSEDNHTVASRLLRESGMLFKEMAHQEGFAHTLSLLGRIAMMQKDYKSAHDAYHESLNLARKLDHKELLAFCIEGFAALLVAQAIEDENKENAPHPYLFTNSKENIGWAAQLWGHAEALRDAAHLPLVLIDRAFYEHAIASARQHIGEESFSARWMEGQAISLEQALHPQRPEIASMPEQQVDQASMSKPSHAGGLTMREIEVLRLVAQGLTSAQIAEQLVLSPLTVNSHVRSIYNKLDITSRSSATRYAIEHKLI